MCQYWTDVQFYIHRVQMMSTFSKKVIDHNCKWYVKFIGTCCVNIICVGNQTILKYANTKHHLSTAYL